MLSYTTYQSICDIFFKLQTEEEQQHLADLYQPGKTLWRFATLHFCFFDLNFDDTQVDQPTPNANPSNSEHPEDCTSICSGSIIEEENQTLAETIPISGTAFSLNYASDRVRGRTAANLLHIPLDNGSIPAGLKRIELSVQVGGHRFQKTYVPQAGQHEDYTWDGTDAYGHLVQGSQLVSVQIGYVYDSFYLLPSSETNQNFGLLGGNTSTIPTRQEVVVRQNQQLTLGTWDAQTQGLGS